MRSIIIFLFCLFLDNLFAESDFYYKNMIKNRSRVQPEKYNYAVIRNKHDLKYIKNRKFNPNNSSKVYNYVEIKNVRQNIFNSSVNNIGINVNSNKPKRKIVNIVKIKNSSINSNAQLGIKIKSNGRKKIKLNNSNINNSVELKHSDIGSRKERLMYKTYKMIKGK